MDVTVEMGEYKCSNVANSDGNDWTKCAIADSAGNQAMPPVEITVDYGDGSGEQVSPYTKFECHIVSKSYELLQTQCILRSVQ